MVDAAAPSSQLAERTPSPWKALAVILPGMFLNVFDFFAINNATPSLHRDLGSGPAALELIVGGYGLTFALGLVTGGRLGDRYGRRRIFFGGMVLFTVASAAAGAAPSSNALVAARLVQGAAAAVMVPQVLSIIRVSFDGSARRTALAAYGTVIALGQVGGQAVGGALLSADILGLTWRPIFFINIPVAALSLLFGPRRVPESVSPARPSLDLAGVALLTVTSAALILPLIEGSSLGWPAWCWVCLAAVPFGAVAFRTYERRVRTRIAPIMDFALFRSREFTFGLLLNVTLYATIASFFFTFGIFLQQGRGESPLVGGLIFVPLAAGNFLASLSSGRLVARFGRNVLTAGAALQIAGLATLAIGAPPSSPTVAVLAGAAVFGLGQGLLIAPIIGVVLARVPESDAGAASGVLMMTQQMAGTMGLTLVSIGFFYAGSAAGAQGYVDGFRVAVACDGALAILTLLFSRLLAPGRKPSEDTEVVGRAAAAEAPIAERVPVEAARRTATVSDEPAA